MTSRGFTLAELLVVVALLGLVMAGIYMLLTGTMQAYVYGSRRVEVQQETRATLEWAMRVIRNGALLVRAEPHGITVIAPDGMMAAFSNPEATFAYAGARGESADVLRAYPHLVQQVTMRLGPFESTAVLRGFGATPNTGQGADEWCSRDAYIPGGWNVYCR